MEFWFIVVPIGILLWVVAILVFLLFVALIHDVFGGD